jgi:F-type H+-transporting ATPase subunit b
MIERFLERLKELPDEEQAKIANSLQDSGRQPVITTAFDLSSENREQLLTAIREQFGNGVEGNFNTAPDLICGIELKANGHKIAWSLDNYLDNLADNLARLLQEELPRQEAETDEL